MTSRRLFGLIGYPLGHSFSREFFTRKFREEGIDAEYRNFELTDIGELMELIAEYPKLEGLNVTTPYKRQVIPYMDSLDTMAEEVGAVNVVKIIYDAGNPVLKGFNTDVPGFAEALRPLLTGKLAAARGALVLGSGGASSAVVAGLKTLGISATVVSRTPADGQIGYADINAKLLEDSPIVVNATPLGIAPHEDECPPFPYELLTDKNLCFDLIYNPSPTLFMRRCAARGALTSDGLQMLHNQARLSWQIWNE